MKKLLPIATFAFSFLSYSQITTCNVSASESAVCFGSSVTLTASSATSNVSACAGNELPSSLQNSLVGYWPFCGNANDASGNGNNGTVNGATLTTDRFGNANSAYGFDGNDFIEVANNSLLSYTTNFTNSFWCFFSDWNQTGTYYYATIEKPNQYSLQLYKLSNNTASMFGIVIPIIPDNWNFISISNDNGLVSIYSNGALIGTTSISFTSSNNVLYFGMDPGGLIEYTNGKLDDITIYNRTLASDEIQQLYTLGQSSFLWSNGVTTPSITVMPTQTTTYTCDVTVNGLSCSDNVTISVNDPQVNLGPDQDVCQGDSVLLDAGAGYNYYSWNTGETTQTIYAFQGGNYYATVGYETPVSNNYSLAFDGVDDEVITQNFQNLLDFSATAHFKSALPSDPKRIVDMDDASAFYFDVFLSTNGVLVGQIRINSVNTNIIGTTLVADNNWHYLSFVRKADTCYLFVDGFIEAQAAVATDPFSQSNPLVIGHTALNAYPEQHFNGNIDEVTFWNTALSHDQIQQYKNCPPTGDEPGLLGYWKFEEGSGTTTIDLTSNGNNGVLVNVPIWSSDVPDQVCISCTASDTVLVNELFSTTNSIIESNCDTYTAPDGTTYSTTGNYTAVIPNAVGCDSTINIALTITNSNTVSETVFQCDSYTWNTNGQTYNQSGQYTEVLTNQNGCDSTVTLILTITNSNSSSETVTECDTYTWITNGQTYTQSGQYTEVLLNQSGCDSTVTLDLTINTSSSSSQTDTGLDSYTWPINNQTYTLSGTYSAVIPNAAGCDSTITLNLSLDFTGIGENKASFLAVYPNPTTSMLTIEGEWIVNKEYTLVDIQGRIVLNGTFKSNKETIDLKTIAHGQYMLKVEGKEMKVVKE